MDTATYRNLLEDALLKDGPSGITSSESDSVLTLVGSVRGLGARGEHVGFAEDGQRVTIFSRGEVRRMLAKLDRAQNAGIAAERWNPGVRTGPPATGQ